MTENEKYVHVVVCAAVPIDKLNAMGTKIVGVFKRASKADYLAKITNDSNSKQILYGTHCKIITTTIRVPFYGDPESCSECYPIIVSYIPVKMNMNPVQTNIIGIYDSREKAIEKYNQIMQEKEINIKNETCSLHAAIITARID